MSQKNKTAVLGGGCFWCLEAIYTQVKGVNQVTSGYAGGRTKQPTYQEVCSGQTGHAEVVKIDYDPNQVRYEDLLNIFFQVHDPTTLNRQGADVGNQYRSVILASDQDQLKIARQMKAKLEKAKVFDEPVVTEIQELAQFYPAEIHHQNYYLNHSDQPYCQTVIRPKLDKFQKGFLQFLAKKNSD